MKLNFKFLIAFALMVISMPVLALTQDAGDASGFNPQTIVMMITPLIVYAATWVAKKVFSQISGTFTLIIVAALSTLVTYLTDLAIDTEISFILQLLSGLGATFIAELLRSFKNKE